MAFFKLASDGKTLVFGEYSKKHGGKPVAQVAKEDPGYLQWARRERTVGLAPELFDALDDVMVTAGVPFTKAKKKKDSPHKPS